MSPGGSLEGFLPGSDPDAASVSPNLWCSPG